ncbi:hypothetical protein Tco_0450316 [Tanacetum coccineum]
MEEINNFQQEPDETLYQAWERFKELLMRCPKHYLIDMQEVILFYKGLEVPTRQILNSKGAIPTMTVADAKVAIQEMVEHTQKWYDKMSTRTRSTETSDGLVVIQAQLNLGREIKKEIRASMDAAIRNQGASIKTLDIQIGCLYDYHCDEEEGSYGLKDLDAYSIGTTLHNDALPQKKKDPGSFTLPCYIDNVCFEKSLADLGASLIVMPFLTYTNLGLGKLAHTKLTVELANRNHRSLKTVLYNTSCRIGSLFSRRLHNSNLPKDVKEALDLGKTIFVYPHARFMCLKEVVENMDAYRYEGIGEVIVGEPFCKASYVEARRFDRIITIFNGNDGVSEQDKMNGISHSYQKLKGLSKGILDLGLEFIRDEKIVERIIRGHISMHELE